MADQAETRGEKNPQPASSRELKEQMQNAEEALTARPTISIRFRLVVGFMLCFFLSGAIAVATVAILYQVRFKLQFLETTDMLQYEVQEARRLEKNYFLYGTDPRDALRHAQKALSLLEAEEGNVLEVAGEENLSALTKHLGIYTDLLATCSEREIAGGWTTGEKEATENRLREHGGLLLQLAATLTAKERASVNRMIRFSQAVPFISLGLLLLLIFYILHFLVRAIMGPLKRFQGYYRRIAEGDFSPIEPARRYRDEFSDLAMALNRMILELKTHEDTCVQAAKMAAVGTLTSGVAHELNNPLNNVAITTESLMEDFKTLTDEEKWKYLQDIYFENERASETVKSLLDFTRREKPQMGPLTLAEVIASTVRLIQNEMKLNDVSLVSSIPEDLPEIRGAANPLKHLFLNLFLNAVNAMPDGGRMTVSAEKDGDFVRVDVSDEGTGIPPENIPHLFEPFFTTKAPGSGTGLGLSVSYGIIEKHGGDILVESKVGEGSTFKVLLPLAEGRRE